MTDHKFTDEEVIKALEICQKAKCWGDCEDMGCPAASRHGCRFYLRTDEDYEGVIQDEMLKDALDLINRQNAELDDLREIVFMDRTEAIKNLKAEAVKEFAERLKLSAYMESTITGYQYPVVDVSEIDNLVKEMTGEQKHFTPAEVRQMSPKEVRENYQAIMDSMKEWK